MQLLRLILATLVVSLCVKATAQDGSAVASKKAPSVTVEGAVNRPADVLFPQARELSIIDAISLAGGPTSNADLKRVWLIRKNASGDPEKTVIDVVVFWRDHTLKAPTLRSGDRVVIIGRDVDE